MSAVLFFASILSLFVLLDLLVLGRMYVLARTLRGRKYWRTLLIVWGALAIGFCLTAMLANPTLGGRRDPLPRWLVTGEFIWHFLVMPVLAVVLILGFSAETFRSFLRRLRPSPQPSPGDLRSAVPGEREEGGISRRNFLTSAAILAAPIATGSMAVAAAAELGKFRVHRYDLALPTWPRALDNYTVTVIADIHVGEFSTQKMLDDIAATSNRLKSDLVLLPGDLINISHADLPGALDMVLRLDSRDGVYMVQGNHDLIQGPDSFNQAVWRRGINLLNDDSAIITARGVPFQLLGTRWFSNDYRDASVAYTAGLREPDMFAMMMAHHPHSWDIAADHGIPLVISGHTHGGQIMLTKTMGGGPLRFRYWSGRYDRPGSTLIVSNGVGNWFPLRINAPAEILHLTMHPLA
jgi:predicted MPP superfamily phosphohydrolase